MKTQSDHSHFHWLLAAAACLFISMCLAATLVYWGITHDLHQVRNTLMESEMNRLRSHGTRTVAHIQDYLHREPFPTEIQRVTHYEWLRTNWARFVTTDASRQYSAIVDDANRVVMHSDSTREGTVLEPAWYDQIVTAGTDGIVDTRSPALTGGMRAYVVQIPIAIDGQPIAHYHSGLSYQWLEDELAARRANILGTWAWISAGMVALIAVSAFCLYQISRRIAVLRDTLAQSRLRRLAEMGQLVAGLAHEIRNPLNAIMMNNHVVGRFLQNLGREPEHGDSAREQAIILRETTHEIVRMEGMLRVLLGYARPNRPHYEEMNVSQEVRSALLFLKEALDRSTVLVRARLPDAGVMVQFDRDRFRQILLNLMANAQEATGEGGTIDIEVRGGRELVELIVSDDGPGVPAAERERIFEPFFSTKDAGTGLGLPLVRRYLEEEGGVIVCEDHEPRGARFRVRIPVGPRTPARVSREDTAAL